MTPLIIALNTFREAIRNKILYTIFFFAICFIALAVTFSTMGLESPTHILINMGLFTIEVFGTMIAIFVGVSLVYKELERRTIYTILSRPIERWQFILGKYLGLVMTTAAMVLLFSAIFLAVFAFLGDTDRIPSVLLAIWFCLVKLMVVTAVAVFFSSISSPILSGIFTLGYYIIASSSGYLPLLLPDEPMPFLHWLIRMLNYLLPDFRFLDVKTLVVHGESLSAGLALTATAYGLMYAFIVIGASMLVFDRRDLK